MSLDQCHSTVGEKPVVKPRAVAHEGVGVTGRKYYRGLDDLADTASFREWLERELPDGASRLLDSSRRTFLKIMGASVALAGAATLPGCRRPDHKIYPYSRAVPEEVIPGKAIYYATSLALPGGTVEGVVVETHENRPTKIEGNPLHPGNQGRTSAWSQASVLSLYDPDRLMDPYYLGGTKEQRQEPRSWEDFAAWLGQRLPALRESRGEGLAVVVDGKRSPSREAMRARLKELYPRMRWVSYDPARADGPARGAAAALGRPARESLSVDRADVIVSLDRDFLSVDDPGFVRNTRGFASRRSPKTTADGMNRLYAVESTLSLTGANADHRVAMAPGVLPAFAGALAVRLAGMGAAVAPAVLAEARRLAEAGGALVDGRVVEAAAKDLAAARGKSLVLAGPTQPAGVHALVHALNAALGNVGATVRYLPMGEDEAAGTAGLRGLAEALSAKAVTTLVCVGVNPAYDAPGDLGFAKAMENAGTRVALAYELDETAAGCTWALPMAHALESWGDLESNDGVLSPQQPMIAPLYAGKSELELLAMLAGDALDKADGHALVRSTWQRRMARGDFEAAWRRALNDGVFGPEFGAVEALRVEAPAAEGVAGALRGVRVAAPGEDRMDVVFTMGNLGDGRFINNAWLQELPDPITKVVWDNVALVSLATAQRLGAVQEDETDKVRRARMISVTAGGQTVRVPAWVTPGIPDDTVVLQLGYGRARAGRVGEGAGFNVYPVSGVGGAGRRYVAEARVERSAEGERWYPISTTQSHGSMEGRAIVREVDLPAWQRFGDEIEKNRDAYGNERKLVMGERLGELSHTPANINAYVNPQRGSKTEKIEGTRGEHGSAAFGYAPLSPAAAPAGARPDFASGPQWGMSIDLAACTGCSTCMVACQAENNVAVVGKAEVNKGREMHWLRIDRYFSGEGSGGTSPDGVMFQPVLCVHCENAPCEVVCPVNATVHGPEGINYMVYNRCIGTRYCANNCPYKVRRFNFFDYGVKRLNGDYVGKGALSKVGADPANVNLIPPRLRERLPEISKLQKNPNVTVRSRGVMEKCTFCIQRVNEARIEMKLRNMDFIPDGFVQTACQQACPADAIIFGDLNDKTTQYPEPGGGRREGSKAHRLREHGRSYMLLGYLNTRPRVTHMINVRNPNPELLLALGQEERVKDFDNPFRHGHGSHDDKGPHHVPPGPGAEHHTMHVVDPVRRGEDRGYRLSLGVLGTGAAPVGQGA
jgi:molybdopterin-containing oxidoreductase family iron-sulfur binding subunit